MRYENVTVDGKQAIEVHREGKMLGDIYTNTDGTWMWIASDYQATESKKFTDFYACVANLVVFWQCQ